MKKTIPLDKKLIDQIMNRFDAKIIAFTSEKDRTKPEVRAKLIEQAVDEALSLKNEAHLVNRDAYIRAVVSSLFKEGKIREIGEDAYLELIKGAQAAEHRIPHDSEVGIRNK